MPMVQLYMNGGLQFGKELDAHTTTIWDQTDAQSYEDPTLTLDIPDVVADQDENVNPRQHMTPAKQRVYDRSSSGLSPVAIGPPVVVDHVVVDPVVVDPVVVDPVEAEHDVTEAAPTPRIGRDPSTSGAVEQDANADPASHSPSHVPDPVVTAPSTSEVVASVLKPPVTKRKKRSKKQSRNNNKRKSKRSCHASVMSTPVSTPLSAFHSSSSVSYSPILTFFVDCQ